MFWYHANLIIPHVSQVQEELKEHLSGKVNLVFENNDGDDVTVHAELGWQSLVKLVQVKRWACLFVRPIHSPTSFT